MFIILLKIQYDTAKRISFGKSNGLFANGGRQNVIENSKIYNSVVVNSSLLLLIIMNL